MEIDKKTNIKFSIIAIISIIVFAFAISPKTLQNDTFYTIKIGEYVMENGITFQDPFSWHNLSYTFPHWAYDVMIYLIYNVGGQLGIYISTIVFASILGILIYFVNDKFTKNKPISFVLTITAMFLLKDYITARAQLFTFILFLLEVFCIESFLNTGKKRHIVGLIIIPIILANVHVAVFPFYFVLYLPYVAEYLIALLFKSPHYFNNKKIAKIEKLLEKEEDPNKIEKLNQKLNKANNYKQKLLKMDEKDSYKIILNKKARTKALIIIMIICIFTGFLTPLKTTPYTYLFKTMKGNSLSNISEHLPLTLADNVIFAIVLLSYLSILAFTDTKIRLCDLFMLFGLTMLTFMSRRQESMFIIICIPILNRLLTDFIKKYDKEGIEQMKKLMVSFLGGFITICLVLILSILLYNNRFKDVYINNRIYPVDASEWILENLDVEDMKLYNAYNYGSYLIFKGIPVFIDSRADLYLPEFNENVNIFDDFLTMSNLNTFKMDEMFEKYGFTHFITMTDAKLRIYLDLQPEKYKIIYSDDYFYIYEKL